MKHYPLMIIVLIAIFGFTSDSSEFEDYTPILMSRTNLEKSIHTIDPIPITDPGKIYIKDDKLFIVERFTGIHVIENSDPSHPVNVKFIVVPGIVDLSIKNNSLYADNAVDLVSVNISNLQNIYEVSRIRNVFPELPHPKLMSIPYKYTKPERPRNTIIVRWQNRAS